jgi:predicted dehydrogenase
MTGLTIGIIGLGGAGRAHAQRFARNPHVGRVIGFDPRPGERVIGRTEVERAADLDELLERSDGVSVCSPDPAHFEHLARCLAHGRHVLVEKPMVASAAEAAALEPMVERRPDTVVAVHHQMRFAPAFARTRELVAEGALGTIFHVQADYWHDMRRRSTAYDAWRMRGSGQSVIFGAACHPLDLVLDLVGEPVTSHVTYANKIAFDASPAAATAATTMLRFAGGAVATCHVNSGAVYPQLNDLVVLGTDGACVDGILYRDGAFRRLVDAHALMDSQSRARQARAKLLVNPIAGLLGAAAMRLPLFRRNPFNAYNHERACRALVDDFVDAVRGGGAPRVPFADGRRVIDLCDAIEREAIGTTTDGSDPETAPTLGVAA